MSSVGGLRTLTTFPPCTRQHLPSANFTLEMFVHSNLLCNRINATILLPLITSECWLIKIIQWYRNQFLFVAVVDLTSKKLITTKYLAGEQWIHILMSIESIFICMLSVKDCYRYACLQCYTSYLIEQKNMLRSTQIRTQHF